MSIFSKYLYKRRPFTFHVNIKRKEKNKKNAQATHSCKHAYEDWFNSIYKLFAFSDNTKENSHKNAYNSDSFLGIDPDFKLDLDSQKRTDEFFFCL